MKYWVKTGSFQILYSLTQASLLFLFLDTNEKSINMKQHKMNSPEDGELVKIRCLSPFVEGWKSKKQETKLEEKKIF